MAFATARFIFNVVLFYESLIIIKDKLFSVKSFSPLFRISTTVDPFVCKTVEPLSVAVSVAGCKFADETEFGICVPF